MIGQVQEINGSKVAVPISGSIPTGLPVGTWISFEKDQAPDNKWIKAGETFDENLYPALYLFLGTNKVPERFDHSRLSELEQVVAYTTTTQPVTAQYDGFFIVTNASSVVRYIQINGQDKMRYLGNNALDTITFSVKKDDVLTISGQSSVTAFEVYASYYKHPMFIKATSAIEITDQNTFLNTVQSLVQTANSYSTEEIATGGTWIDGKPIYRKAGFIASIGTSETLLDSLLTTSYVDKIINGSATFEDSNGSKHLAGTYAYSNSPRVSLFVKSDGLKTMARTSDSRTQIAWWIEYTKN